MTPPPRKYADAPGTASSAAEMSPPADDSATATVCLRSLSSAPSAAAIERPSAMAERIPRLQRASAGEHSRWIAAPKRSPRARRRRRARRTPSTRRRTSRRPEAPGRRHDERDVQAAQREALHERRRQRRHAEHAEGAEAAGGGEHDEQRPAARGHGSQPMLASRA